MKSIVIAVVIAVLDGDTFRVEVSFYDLGVC